MAKVGRALLEGDTGDQVESVATDGTAAGGRDNAAAANAAVTGGVGGQQAVRPQFFKALAGKGHQEFSSGRQQVGGKGYCGHGHDTVDELVRSWVASSRTCISRPCTDRTRAEHSNRFCDTAPSDAHNCRMPKQCNPNLLDFARPLGAPQDTPIR